MKQEFNEILITGGSGSLGTKLIMTLLRLDTDLRIRVLSRNEKSQYVLRKGVEEKFGVDGVKRLRCFLGDVRDESRLELAMSGVDFTIHAAALKHINMGEEQPEEFVRTNIIGTLNVVNCSKKNGKKMLLISTDKACLPVNNYGMTKAIAERIVTNAGYSCVRYGNVAASSGSVIPFFHRLINEKRELTVTDPRMTRFFMTLDDAVTMVLHAMEKNGPGDILVKKADSFRIIDLARYMGERYGHSPDYPIRIIGLQTSGEKIDEMLVAPHEIANASDIGDFIRIFPPTANGVDKPLEEPYSSKNAVIDYQTKMDELFQRIGKIEG